MNDLLNNQNSPFVQATLIGKIGDQPINWAFPVMDGTPRDLVQAEIRMRCTGEYAALMSDPSTQIRYPAGPWTAPLTPDNPPIGVKPPVPPSVVPTPPVAPQIVPPQGGSGTAPPQRRQAAVEDLGPLPEPQPKQSTEQAALSDLEHVLMQWRQKHGITSAEFFTYTARITAYYAGQLVARERQPRR